MAMERRKLDLDGPSLIAAVLINIHSAKSVTPLDIHPYRESDNTNGMRLTRSNIGAIAAAVTRQFRNK